MPVQEYPDSGSIWFESTNLVEGAGFPLLSIWDDGEVILEASPYSSEFISPTLEEWEFLAQIVNTNIERLRRWNNGN